MLILHTLFQINHQQYYVLLIHKLYDDNKLIAEYTFEIGIFKRRWFDCIDKNNIKLNKEIIYIWDNENITVGKVWEIMPFDNFVKTCTMTVDLVIESYYANDVLHSDNVEVRNGKLYYNGQECSDDQTFTVAAVDYIFDKTEYPFLQAQDQKSA